LDKPVIRYVFFEDLNFGWVITPSQYRRLEAMGDELELPEHGFILSGRKPGDFTYI